MSAVLMGATSVANAQSAAEFYNGRNVTMMLGTGAGGTYALHAQIFKGFFQKYLPPGATLVLQYKPGGGGSKMANYLYNVAPRDGSFFGFPLKYIAVNKTLGRKGLKYDASKLGYLGSLGPINSAVAIYLPNKQIKSLAEAKSIPVIMGATGKSSETFITPTLMNNLLGTKFKIVTGYKGTAGIQLAIERGEVHGRAASWDSLKTSRPQWLTENKVALLAQSGLERNWDLQDVPTLLDLAETKQQKEVLEFFANGNAVGWLMITPPGVPKDRFAALRSAFTKTVNDPAYIAAAKKRKLDIKPKTGAVIENLINKTVNVSPALIKRIKTAMGVK